MSEWWTYRPSDFLLFSARTYYRLFELYNADLWPAPLLTLGLGVGCWIALWQERAWAQRTAAALLAIAWIWIAWAFHWQRFASVNWAATWYAAAFAIEGLMLAAWAVVGAPTRPSPRRDGRRRIGLALWALALGVHPVIGVLLGRSWPQAEIFGLAPDPTVLTSLGFLLLVTPARGPGPAALAWLAWLLWPIPLLWCATTGITLATMQAADSWLMPAAAVLALLIAWRNRRNAS